MNVKSKAILIMLVVFSAGVAVGALSHRAVMRGRVRGIIRMREAGLLVPWRGPIMDRITPEQREPIDKIFHEHGKRLAAIHERLRKEIDAEFAAMWEEIKAVLTPEQRQELEKIVSSWPPPPFPGRPGQGMPPGPGMGPGGRPPGAGPGPGGSGPGQPPPGGPGFRGPGGAERPGEPPGKPVPPPKKPDEKRPPGNSLRLGGVQ